MSVRLLALLLWLFLAACSQPEMMHLQGSTMGTSYSIKLPRPPERLSRVELQQAIDGLLAEVNSQMSTYDPDSHLSRFNNATHGKWQSVPAPLMQVLQAAAEIHQLSDGVFDPTVGPLVNLWGFGPVQRTALPDRQQIDATRQHVGYSRLLELDSKQSRLRKRDAAVYVDLSAIAKGYAVDLLAELLNEQGLRDYMVEIGGEIRVSGLNAQHKPWRLAVENPSPAGRSVHGILSVTEAGVATSGDYRNFFEHEGRLYSHTIDPRSGYPVAHELASVTVVHPSAMWADGLATAMMVLGPEDGMRLARNLNLAVWFILRDGQNWIDRYSPAMHTYRVNLGP